MPKTKSEKQTLIELYKKELGENPNYIFVSMDSVNTPEINELKTLLRDSKSKFMVVKNTLFKIAAQELDQPNKVQELEENSGMIVFGEDPTLPAKALKEIQKKYENMSAKFGVIFGEITEEDKIKMLAQIPPREILLAKLVGSMSSPVSGFMSVLTGNVRNLVYALAEIQKNKSTAN